MRFQHAETEGKCTCVRGARGIQTNKKVDRIIKTQYPE